ncbi:GRAS family protein [Vampirovibrio sp.]|uniref:GRAS family protein n=1 Tax=Vampirovibrio sp. TaxID=2717857 RepID=UPI00359460CD
MQTMAGQIHQSRFEQFERVIQAIEHHQLAEAGALLQAISESLPAQQSDAESIHTSFFLKALEQRLSGSPALDDNLYLLPDEGQQIQMFTFMAQQFPVVRYAQELMNQWHLQVLRGETRILLWDIGMGNGQQIVRLLQALIQEANAAGPEEITIIGLEPSGESLTEAEKALQAFCDAAGVSLRFKGIAKTVEALQPTDWAEIAALTADFSGKWIANASFALHHIHPTTTRTVFFKKIQTLKPAIFGFIEPYADFLTPSLKDRFQHAWRHYGLAFWAIDQIEAPLESRNLLKTVFFGREIMDVIGKDQARIEQFETGEMWGVRLKEAGWQCIPVSANHSAIPGFESIEIEQREGFTAFLAQGYPVISLLGAKAGEP